MPEKSNNARRLLGLATGVAFGALLRRGGLDDSRTIVGQLEGTDARVAKTMGSAVAVAALGHRWLLSGGQVTTEPKPLNPVAVVGGSLLFGAGMALSGYCPGTAAVAVGSGRREGAWAAAGMLVAAAGFVASYPRLKKALETGGAGKMVLLGGKPPAPRTALNVAVRPGAQRFEAAAAND
ncbi:MAG: YeeE/YedE family protein [Burkholderiaceae bacterium]|nr:YeeE/YedE family protein [Burkholderiaceae bacterium]